jgi:hypothetical protein
VIDENPLADPGSGMNLSTRPPADDEPEEAGKYRNPQADVKKMDQAVSRYGLEARSAKNHLKKPPNSAGNRRIALFDRLEIFDNRFENPHSMLLLSNTKKSG